MNMQSATAQRPGDLLEATMKPKRKLTKFVGFKDKMKVYEFLQTILEKDETTGLWKYKHGYTDKRVAEQLSPTLDSPCSSNGVSNLRYEMFGKLISSPDPEKRAKASKLRAEFDELKGRHVTLMGDVNVLLNRIKTLEGKVEAQGLEVQTLKLALKHKH